MRSDGQDAEAALRHENPRGESIYRSRKIAFGMNPYAAIGITQAKVYSFRGVAACAKLLEFWGVCSSLKVSAL
jgi:hypothetical protein